MGRDWYYQVWVHCDREKEVEVVSTWKTKWQAQKEADSRNAMVINDTRPDNPPRRFYFVRPILAEELKAEMEERYKRELKEDTEYFMSQYRGEFLPYARDMVKSMLRSIETCESSRHFILDEKGGWLYSYCAKYDYDCMITCSAIYSGADRVSLEVAFERMNNKDALLVKVFKDEDEFIMWLIDAERAAKACEEKLIEICCDRHRSLHWLSMLV